MFNNLTQNSAKEEVETALAKVPWICLRHCCQMLGLPTRRPKDCNLMRMDILDKWDADKAHVLTSYHVAVALREQRLSIALDIFKTIAQILIKVVLSGKRIDSKDGAIELINDTISTL